MHYLLFGSLVFAALNVLYMANMAYTTWWLRRHTEIKPEVDIALARLFHPSWWLAYAVVIALTYVTLRISSYILG
jgi:hypothetical protein